MPIKLEAMSVEGALMAAIDLQQGTDKDLQRFGRMVRDLMVPAMAWLEAEFYRAREEGNTQADAKLKVLRVLTHLCSSLIVSISGSVVGDLEDKKEIHRLALSILKNITALIEKVLSHDQVQNDPRSQGY